MVQISGVIPMRTSNLPLAELKSIGMPLERDKVAVVGTYL
jgi:hypothetical protein